MEIELKVTAIADDFGFTNDRDFLEIYNYGRDDNNITLQISKEMFLKIISEYKEKYNEEE
tara:strand:- start:376 stop:555 length:180 start_codon:yes stop_codon:yes gene_type:complete